MNSQEKKLKKSQTEKQPFSKTEPEQRDECLSIVACVSLEEVPLEVRKLEAEKPLFLTRYE